MANSETNEAREDLLTRLNREAWEAQIIGEYHNRHGDFETGRKYLDRADALRWLLDVAPDANLS